MKKIYILFVLIISTTLVYSQCAINVDFHDWHREASPTSNWVVSPTGNSVEQTDNGYNTFYINDDNLVNIEMTGELLVNTATDDDPFGIACGYVNPIGSPANNYDFYLIDWKQSVETWGAHTCDEGFVLSDVHGVINDISKYFFGHFDDANLTVLQTNNGPTKGWADLTTYNYKLIYKTSDIIFIVDNDTVINYQGCFDAGKVGVYNYSQPNTIYSNFSINHLVDFTYSNICENDTAKFTFVDLNCAPNFDESYIAAMNWDYGDGNAFSNVSVNHTNINPKHKYTVAGTYNVQLTVTDTSGCVSTITNQIIVNSPPNAVASSNSPLCLGDDLQLDASTYLGATYAWVGPNSYTSISQNPILTNVSFQDSGYYYVIAQQNGCVGDVDSVFVQINSLPTSTFTASEIMCYSDSTRLIYTGNALPTATYNWSYNGGAASGNNVSWINEGSHDVTLEVTENGCSSTTTISVLNPDSLYSSYTINDISCFGNSDGEIIIQGEGGTPTYNYSWSTGNGSNLASGNYSVTITDANSCLSTNTIELTQPEEIYAFVSNDTVLCSGGEVVLLSTGIGGSSPYSFFWDGVAGGATNTVNPQSTQTYNVQIEDANGCRSDFAYVTITVNPSVNINLIMNTDSVCPGEEIIITPMISQGDGGPYTIYYENGALISPPIIINPDTTYNLVVFATDVCGSIDSDTAKIHILPLPDNNFSFDKNSICQDETVQFNEASADEEGTQYIWDFGDNNNLSYDKNPTHTYDSYGDFDISLTVISPEGCVKKVSEFNAISVHENPIADFQAFPQVANIISPTINFSNYSTIFDTCIWTFSDGDTIFNLDPSHTFRDVGTFQVQLIVGSLFGCKDTSYTNVIIEDQQTFYAPTAFTPDFDGVNDIFKISGHGIQKEDFAFIVFDRWGGEIFSTTDINKGWDGINSAGKVFMDGTYLFAVRYKNLQGEEVRKTGSFNLIR